MEPKRESEEAKDVDLRGVDVCVGRRYEAASQDMDNWETKAYTEYTTGASHHPWMNHKHGFGSGALRIP